MPITYDRRAVYDAVRVPVFSGRLYQNQIEGIDGILSEWERLQPAGDPHFVAYMLATASWETAHTMRPVEEYGHGRGRAYGTPTGPWHQVYDGRGDVQLTWETNYRKATQRLRAKGVIGADLDLEKTPALAMRADIAAAIMLFGMVEGWFTGKTLADYFNVGKSDWVNARRIINGTDQAATIAGYGKAFYAGLKAGSTNGAAVAAKPAAVLVAQAKAEVASPVEAPAPIAAMTVAKPVTEPAVASLAPTPAQASEPGLISRIASLFG